MDQAGGTPGEGVSPSHQWLQETVDWGTTVAACLLSLGVSTESEEAGLTQATNMVQIGRQGAAQLAGGETHLLRGPCCLTDCSQQLLLIIQAQMGRVLGSPRSPGRLRGGFPG